MFRYPPSAVISRVWTRLLLNRGFISSELLTLAPAFRISNNSYITRPLTSKATSLSKHLNIQSHFRRSLSSNPKTPPSTESKPVKVPINNVVKEQSALSSSVWTVPNILTFTRILTTPFIGYFIVTGDTKIALLIFVYSCVTDFVDGFIARRYNMKSVIGSIIDPLADKFLMTVCTLSLAYVHTIPTAVASLIIGRDVMLSFWAFYIRYMSLSSPKTLKLFLDIAGNPTVTVHPNLLGKVNTGLQMLYIGGLVFKPVVESIFLYDLSIYFEGMGWFVGATTLLSGLSYIFSRNSIKYLKK